jgi:peroxin-10
MFTRRLFPGEQRPGYELLGLLLLLQIAAQSYLSLTADKTSDSDPTTSLIKDVLSNRSVAGDSEHAKSPIENDSVTSPDTVLDLADENVLPYITSGSRRCPLCLDPMKDPTAAECGHLFCWTCILRWTGEAIGLGECPICRGRCGREGLLRLSG